MFIIIVIFYADDVIVTGILTAKWSPDFKDVRCDLDPVLIANNLRLVSEIFLALIVKKCISTNGELEGFYSTIFSL